MPKGEMYQHLPKATRLPYKAKLSSNMQEKTMIIRTPKDSQKLTQILNEIEIGICVEERHFKVNLMGLERKSRFLVNSWSSDSFCVEWLF